MSVDDGPVRVLRYGPHAWLIELASALAVAPVVDALRALRLADIDELVPGACTVLVRLSERPIAGRRAIDPERLRVVAEQATVAAAAADPGTLDVAAVVEIPVRYDGDDLAEVAAASGLSVAEVIAIHGAPIYRGAFCGFAPGFCYLTGLPDELHVARRSTPRSRVPAGSVAIADDWCAVYPTPSPGGWRLLGTTDARIWDVRRQPPNQLGPGTFVRFVPVTHTVTGRTERHRHKAGRRNTRGTPAVEIVDPGPLATVQDGGRPGWAHLGVTRSGPMDVSAARRANRLVGNDEDAAVIEVTFGGIGLRALTDVIVAISGAPCSMSMLSPLRPDPHPRGGIETPFVLRATATLRIAAPVRGVRTYVAFRGGIAGGTMPRHDLDDIDIGGDDERVLIEPVLGSLSSDVLGGIGPPPLRAGAQLWLGRGDVAPITVDIAPIAVLPAAGDVVTVPIVAGPRLDWCERAIDALTATRWTVGPDSNRVGIRLIGDGLQRRITTELRSEPLIAGAIQIPPDGQPIVFGPDHPTTGGYPVVALVVDGGLDRLAQARPGLTVRFRMTP